MLGRIRRSRSSEDPAVAHVERLLQAAAARRPATGQRVEGRGVARHALWICACVSWDDASTWLIYDTDEDGIAWGRVSGGGKPLDLVDARLSASGHADPAEVLRWLQGKASDPWAGGGGGGGDAGVLKELAHRVRT